MKTRVQLHQKLIERSLAMNAFLFDADRLAALNKVAAPRGFEREVTAILGGFRADSLLGVTGLVAAYRAKLTPPSAQ